MIDQPHIVQTEAAHTAVVRLIIPRSQIQEVMGPAIGEVFAVIGSQGVAPAGPVFSRHFRMDPQVFDFEVGVPVGAPVTPSGRVIASELPAARAARTVYQGPYEGLGDAWGEFDRWLTGQGLATAPGLWECYVVGPESGPDPASWRTELNKPLVD
jgi:effector-binding domain-containing protein